VYESKQIDEIYLVRVTCADEAAERPPAEEGKGAAPDPELSALEAALRAEFADIIVYGLPPGIPPARDVDHEIPLEPDAKPVPRQPTRRLSPAEHAECQRQLASLLEKGLIRPSKSGYGANILFARKKDGSLRMCIDYRALNKQSKKNKYPLPRIDDLLDRLGGAQYFSSIDLASGYHQIRMAPGDIEKTAFTTRLGLYEFVVLPFGLTNAPATFQTLMNGIFHAHLGQFVIVYLDDIMVYSRTLEEHISHLRQVLSLLREHKLYAQERKCELFKTELKWIGHRVGSGSISTDPRKVEVINEWPAPANQK